VESTVENVNPAGDIQEPAAPVQPTPTQDASENPIRNEAFLNKVLHEKKSAMERLQKLESENKLYRENELKRQDNYKLLVEEKDKELTDLRERMKSREDLIVKATKTSAIKKELTNLGCDAKYLDKATQFVNLENINYDESTGVVTGQLEAAKAVQEELPPFFGSMNVGVNQNAPAGHPTPLTIEAWKQLPHEERKKRQGELYQNLNITRRK